MTDCKERYIEGNERGMKIYFERLNFVEMYYVIEQK